MGPLQLLNSMQPSEVQSNHISCNRKSVISHGDDYCPCRTVSSRDQNLSCDEPMLGVKNRLVLGFLRKAAIKQIEITAHIQAIHPETNRCSHKMKVMDARKSCAMGPSVTCRCSTSDAKPRHLVAGGQRRLPRHAGPWPPAPGAATRHCPPHATPSFPQSSPGSSCGHCCPGA